MCGRYYTKRQKQEIAERMRAKKVFDEPFLPNYNIAPTTFQPIMRQERDSDERELILARWGLVPFFAKSLADFKGFSTFNARAEGITTAPTWRAPFKLRRCIVPADGFYEWKASDDSKKPKKQPYAITLKSGEPFAFAGLWDAWKEPKGVKESGHTPDTWLQSFSIITTEANELLSTIHTRMPIILHERDWNRWLDRDSEKLPPVHLLRPYDSVAMQMHPCNPAVGNVRNNGEEMLVCTAPDALPLNSASRSLKMVACLIYTAREWDGERFEARHIWAQSESNRAWYFPTPLTNDAEDDLLNLPRSVMLNFEALPAAHYRGGDVAAYRMGIALMDEGDLDRDWIAARSLSVVFQEPKD